MNFKYGSTKEILSFFNAMETYVENHIEYYKEFELMSPSFFKHVDDPDTPEFGTQYLLYLNEQQKVLGILKWKRYGIPHHEFVSEEEAFQKENYVAIRFIDVAVSERKKGIAIALIHH
jgi:hypothetical protein